MAANKAATVVPKVSGNAPKADFYVTPNGTAFSSTGHRYFGDEKTLNSAQQGILPAKENGMYFSFDKYDDALEAKDKLQIPYAPTYRASFDTLDNIDNFQIPKGKWNQADYFEPITKDFPNFGTGGATQGLINNHPVNIYDLYKMK